MNDTHLRELERELERTGTLDARIALAETQRQMGDPVLAAITIMPAAFEPNAEATIRALAGPRPETYAAAVDLLAHKTFYRTDDLAVRFAYLRRRIPVAEFSDAVCELLPRLADANMRAELRITPSKQTIFSLSTHPNDATPLYVTPRTGMHGNPEFETALDTHLSLTILRRTYEQLQPHITPEQDAGRIHFAHSHGRTTDNAAQEYVSYFAMFKKETTPFVLELNTHQVLHSESRNQGPTTNPSCLHSVTLLEPRGAL